MNNTFEAMTAFIKAIVRPYIICCSWTFVCLMWFNQIEVPLLLLGIAGTISLEYVGERVVKRVKETK